LDELSLVCGRELLNLHAALLANRKERSWWHKGDGESKPFGKFESSDAESLFPHELNDIVWKAYYRQHRLEKNKDRKESV
jgi:hypothetical protein